MAKAPPLIKADPTQLEDLAVKTDASGYAQSDADYLKRFPDLVAARDSSIQNATDNLNGKQDPIYNNAFESAGLGKVDLGNQFETARNLGQPILAKEQRDRTYFERLFSSPQNQERQFGLSPGDIANVALANSGAQTQFNQALLGSNIDTINAQSAQSAALASVIGGIGGKLTSAGINYATQPSVSPSLNANYYTTGYANTSLPHADPDYGNSNYIGLGDSGTTSSTTSGGF